MESLIKNLSSLGVKFEAEFLMSISFFFSLLLKAKTIATELHSASPR